MKAGEAVVCVYNMLLVPVICLFVSFFLFFPFLFFLSIYTVIFHVHVLQFCAI